MVEFSLQPESYHPDIDTRQFGLEFSDCGEDYEGRDDICTKSF